MPTLPDKYRPDCFDRFVGNEKALRRLSGVLGRADFDGGAFWISGSSGIGKTTLAELIAARFAAPSEIARLNGDSCSVDAVQTLGDSFGYFPMAGTWKAAIVNEAQAMTAKAVQAWLTMLDPLASHRLVIFTTTDESEEIFGAYDAPFMRRCKRVRLTNQGLAQAFAERACDIAQAEQLVPSGVPRAELVRRIKRIGESTTNMGDILQRIDNQELLE